MTNPIASHAYSQMCLEIKRQKRWSQSLLNVLNQFIAVPARFRSRDNDRGTQIEILTIRQMIVALEKEERA